MKLTNIELVAERDLGTLAQFEDLEHAHLVGQRLAGLNQIPLDLGDDLGFGHAGVGDHVVDRLLARPALGV